MFFAHFKEKYSFKYFNELYFVARVVRKHCFKLSKSHKFLLVLTGILERSVGSLKWFEGSFWEYFEITLLRFEDG